MFAEILSYNLRAFQRGHLLVLLITDGPPLRRRESFADLDLWGLRASGGRTKDGASWAGLHIVKVEESILYAPLSFLIGRSISTKLGPSTFPLRFKIALKHVLIFKGRIGFVHFERNIDYQLAYVDRSNSYRSLAKQDQTPFLPY